MDSLQLHSEEMVQGIFDPKPCGPAKTWHSHKPCVYLVGALCSPVTGDFGNFGESPGSPLLNGALKWSLMKGSWLGPFLGGFCWQGPCSEWPQGA